jgi:hypothetical protein
MPAQQTTEPIMPHTLQLELTEEDLAPMREAAARAGRTLEEWAGLQLRRSAPTEAARREAFERLLARVVDAPEMVGADNERIDADLADEAAAREPAVKGG